MLTLQKFNKILWLQNLIIFETVSHSIINNTIFWKCIMRSFRWMYGNCFNRLRFSAEVSTKLQKKCTFLDKLRTITQAGNVKTGQINLWSPKLGDIFPYEEIVFGKQHYILFICNIFISNITLRTDLKK